MILLTGGLGYIGSHTAVALIEQGYEVVIVDNLVNSNKAVLKDIETISGKKPVFYEIDCCDELAYEEVFKKHSIKACIHFAGLKAVGESSRIPLEYYNNNMSSTLNTLALMKKYKVANFIFSSSATVYGNPKTNPISENFPLSVTNPYGRTKLMVEEMLEDIYKAEKDWGFGILRYFNPIGAHESGLIGDRPSGTPNNVMPYITKVAKGILPCLPVFGDDYETKDGTGVRDYIHVMDLAEGHVAMLKKLIDTNGLYIYNLGTGIGYSVLDLIKTFEKVNNTNVEYRIEARRQGDIAMCFASATKAKNELSWSTKRNLEDMLKSAWNFEKNLVE